MIPDPNDLVGKTVGGYTLQQILGSGGAGTVYLAMSPANTPVAVKILMPMMMINGEQRREFQARFLREAETLTQLDHPHILKVLDYGEDQATKQVFMVMPYLRGGTLATRLASGPLPLDQVVTYITQLASALDYANGRGIIHRDIKPANVLLDEQGNALLADFGIAKIIDTLNTTLTAMNQIIGTPEYIAPEQIRNTGITAETDVYGLGALTYHLVTGRVPFQALSLLEIVQKVTQEVPQPPRTYRNELPQPAEAVILKALAKEPARRFGAASTFATALAQGMRGEWPTGITPPPLTPPTTAATMPPTMSTSEHPIFPIQSPAHPTFPMQPQMSPGGPPIWVTPTPVVAPKRRGGVLAGASIAALVIVVLAGVLIAKGGFPGSSRTAASVGAGGGTATAEATATLQPTNTIVPATNTTVPPTTVVHQTPPTATPIPPPTATAVPMPNVSGTWTGYGASDLSGTGNDCYTLNLTQGTNSTSVTGILGENSSGCVSPYLAMSGTFNGTQLLMSNSSSPQSGARTLVFSVPAQSQVPYSSCGSTTVAMTYYSSTTMTGTVSNCSVATVQFNR